MDRARVSRTMAFVVGMDMHGEDRAFLHPSNAKPRLMEQVGRAIRARHYSRRTEEAYTHWIRRFIVFHGRRHPDELGEAEISAFLTSLAADAHVSASTQNQALSALLFLYDAVLQKSIGDIARPAYAKLPVHVPVVLTMAEVRLVLKELSGVCWLVAALLYGAGSAPSALNREGLGVRSPMDKL